MDGRALNGKYIVFLPIEGEPEPLVRPIIEEGHHPGFPPDSGDRTRRMGDVGVILAQKAETNKGGV